MGQRQSSNGKIIGTQDFVAEPALPDVRLRLFSSSSMWYHSFNSRNWHDRLETLQNSELQHRVIHCWILVTSAGVPRENP